jgi:transposase-like protein
MSLCQGLPSRVPRRWLWVARNRDDGVTIEPIASGFGVHPMALHNWMRQADIDEGAKPGKSTGESAELRAARRRVNLLEQGNEVLCRARPVCRRPTCLTERPGVDILRFNTLDSVFHTTMAQACGNWLIADLAGALRDTVERHRLAAMRALSTWESVSLCLQAEHRRILNAIAAGDADEAAAALRDHLRHTYPEATEQH